MRVGQFAAQESDDQTGGGSADGGTDRVAPCGFANRRPAALLLDHRGRRCIVRFGDAVGFGGVVKVLVCPILVRAVVV